LVLRAGAGAKFHFIVIEMSQPPLIVPGGGPSASDPPEQQNGNGGDQPLSAQEIARLKKTRRNDRRLVTVHCNRASQLVLDRGSRSLININMDAGT